MSPALGVMKRPIFNRGSSLKFPVILLALFVPFSVGRTQVVLDGKFGTSGPITPISGNYDVAASLGKTVGNNLFHSFSQFDLAGGNMATFSGPNNIQNILARVTGPNASSIDGKLVSSIPGANLFFLNPHGVIFGQNAQLDVKGSFVVTSAHSIQLSDGHRFDTVNPSANDPLLTSAPPSAFGFLGPTVAPISFNGSMLSVPNQKSLSVIGGDIQLISGQLMAPGGRINLISLGSAGVVGLSIDDLNASVDTSGFSALGNVTMNNSALLGDDGATVGGGKVVVQAENLSFDSAGIEASALGPENGLGIDILVRNDMSLQNMGYVFSDTGPSSTGNGGNLHLQTHSLELLSGSAMTCDANGTGHGGTVNVTADSIVLDGITNPSFFAGIGARSFSSGNGGDIAITTGSLDIRNGMMISVGTAGAGNGGNLTVSASVIQIDGNGTDSGIIADATGQGNAGNITVDTASLEISNGGRITAAAGNIGSGGSVTVAATDSILLDREEGALFTGIGVPILSGATGHGGDLVIGTGQLTLQNGAEISANTGGPGDGGTIHVTATDIVLDGGQQPTFFTGIEAQTFSSGSGHGGGITVNAGSLKLINGSQINVDTSDTSAGGTMLVTASSINIQSSSALSAASDGQGQGGQITIMANALTLDGQQANGAPGFAGIFAGNFFGVVGNARGGDIVIGPDTSGALSLQVLNGAEISTTTKGASDGGSIFITASTLTLDNHASIQCSTIGSGQAGNISLTVQDSVALLDHSSIAVPAASRDGGNITIAAGALVYLLDSALSASAGDNGGNIKIDPDFFVLNHSSITADAINNNGGNINIEAKFFLRSDSSITADSQFGNPGTILIDAIELDLSGSLVSLPSSLLGAEAQLRERCGVRTAGGFSSFLVLGRGGAPIEPNSPLPTFGLETVGGAAN